MLVCGFFADVFRAFGSFLSHSLCTYDFWFSPGLHLWLIAAGMNARVGPGVVGSMGRKVHENVFVVL